MSKKALCIGINDYPGTAYDLSGCINDANDWAQELLKRGFVVDKLLDAAATKASITGKITCLLQESHNNDLLVITFSGHGTTAPDKNGDEPDGQDEAICPYDVMSNGPLFDDDIHALFSEKISSIRIVFIADSCHSGSVIRGLVTEFDPSRMIRFLPYQTWMNSVPDSSRTPKMKQSRNPGASPFNVDLLLAGCKDSESSFDVQFYGRPNGLFTYHALKILNDKKPETYEVWFQHIDTIFNSLNYGQHPQLSGTDLAKRYNIFEEGEPKTPAAPHIININIK